MNKEYDEPMINIERKMKPLWHLTMALIVSTVMACNQAQVAEPKQETYQDLPVGFTDDGYAFVGNPDATVTIEEWSDAWFRSARGTLARLFPACSTNTSEPAK